MSINSSRIQTTSDYAADSCTHAGPSIGVVAQNSSFAVGGDLGSRNISAHAGRDLNVNVDHPDPAGNIILWLRTDTTYLAFHDAVFKLRAKATGEWFFDSPEYKRWDKGEGEENRYLECRGMPGAGKTSLASAVVEYYRKQASSGTLVLFIYLRHDTQESQTVEKVLASLLSQVVQNRGSVSKGVNHLYSEYKHHQNAFPPAQRIIDILQSEIAAFERTYLIVDALDEYCITNNDKSHQLMGELCHLNVKTLVTSRYHVEFPTAALHLEISAHEDDVQALINECIAKTPRLRRFIAETPGLREVIIQKVTANAKGMILVVRLHIDAISSLKTPGDVLDGLDRLPTTLDGAYELAVERILIQSEEEAEIAMETFSWLLHEERRLKVMQLRHAVSFKAGMKVIDGTRLWQMDDIIAACLALVVVDYDESKGEEFCQFVHFSLKEFFEKNRERYFPDAQRQITEKCLEYSIVAVASLRDGVSGLGEHFHNRYPMCMYATTYWGTHAYKAQNSFKKHHLIFSLYTHSMSPYLANRFTTDIAPLPLKNQMLPQHYALLYLSRYGLMTAMELHCKSNMGSIDDVRDGFGRTSLLIAAKYGHHEVVRLLLENGAGLNVPNPEGETALNFASWEGHPAVVKLLLERGADPSISNNNDCTPLHLAAEKGHLEVMQLLLGKGADSNAQNEDGYTPLYAASLEGHVAAVVLLLEKGADTTISNINGCTPFHCAAATGHLEILQLLLDNGADLNGQDEDGDTPLSNSSREGHPAVVELLLEKGVDLTISDINGSTPLHLAAVGGHLEVVQLLLGKGADPNARDKDGSTPLYGASCCERPALVESLLEKGADPNLSSYSGLKFAPLHLAAAGGHLVIVQLLLGKGADPNAQDNVGNTPLNHASCRGHLISVGSLLENGADPSIVDNNGSAPLHGAAAGGHLAVVEALVHNAVGLHIQDTDRDIALGIAAYWGHLLLVDFLLDSAFDPNTTNNTGQTPLHHASAPAHEVASNASIVSSLLAKGANPNVQDASGATPLLLAVVKGRPDAVSILIQHGADVHIPNNEGKTPLSVAFEKGYLGIAEMIQAMDKSVVMILVQDQDSEQSAGNTFPEGNRDGRLIVNNVPQAASEGSGDGIELEGQGISSVTCGDCEGRGELKDFSVDPVADGKREALGDEMGDDRNAQDEAGFRIHTADGEVRAPGQNQTERQLTHGERKWFSPSRFLEAILLQGTDEPYPENFM